MSEVRVRASLLPLNRVPPLVRIASRLKQHAFWRAGDSLNTRVSYHCGKVRLDTSGQALGRGQSREGDNPSRLSPLAPFRYNAGCAPKRKEEK